MLFQQICAHVSFGLEKVIHFETPAGESVIMGSSVRVAERGRRRGEKNSLSAQRKAMSTGKRERDNAKAPENALLKHQSIHVHTRTTVCRHSNAYLHLI